MTSDRHEKIIEIITTYDVDTQEQLASMLRDAGFDVTQATVSRDIRKLKLTKQVTEYGKSKYVYPGSDSDAMQAKYVSVLKTGFVSMDVAQNLLVMKTVSGMASPLAAAIDGLGLSEVLGSIAGDDTIMVAIRTNADAIRVMGILRDMMK